MFLIQRVQRNIYGTRTDPLAVAGFFQCLEQLKYTWKLLVNIAFNLRYRKRKVLCKIRFCFTFVSALGMFYCICDVPE